MPDQPHSDAGENDGNHPPFPSDKADETDADQDQTEPFDLGTPGPQHLRAKPHREFAITPPRPP